MPSFWSRIAGLFAAKAASGQLTMSEGLFLPQFTTPPLRGTRELLQLYKKSPWLHAVSERISTGVAAVPWRVYVRSGKKTTPGQKAWRYGVDVALSDPLLRSADPKVRQARRRALDATGELREVPDHPLLTMLTAPNEQLTGHAALALVQTHLDLPGEAFLALSRNAQGMPIGYFPLPPHWVLDVPNKLDQSYKLNVRGVQGTIAASEILWFRHPNPENPFGRGSGVGESLGDELETDEYAAKFVKTWFTNGATPATMVTVRNATGQEQLTSLKEKWEQQHRGPNNGNRPFFTAGDLTVSRLDTSFKDQQLIELRKAQRDLIRAVFSVPPEVLGIVENSNRATAQAAFFLFAQGCLTPRLEFLRAEFQHRLVPLFDERLCLEYESPVPEDKEFTLKVATVLPGAFSLNEWRAFAGHDPLPEFEGQFPPLAMPGQAPGTGAQGPEQGDPDAEADPEDDKDKPALESGEPKEEQKALSDPPWALAGLSN